LSDYVTGLISGIAIALIVYGIWQERKASDRRNGLSGELKKMLSDLSEVHNSSAETVAKLEKQISELRLRVDMVKQVPQARGFGVMGV